MGAAAKLPGPARRAAVRSTRRIVRVLGVKGRSELAFWTDVWDKSIRDGALWGENTLELSGDSEVAADYEGRRRQQARAEVKRVLAEAAIDDADYFAGKVVIDIGPGCVGFPDACPAKQSFGIDPLAEEYSAAGLLIESDAIYLSVPAEKIPLVSETVDTVVCRNSLDHVDDPVAVLGEIHRLLKPGGELILNVDLDHPASPTEPHEISRERLIKWLADFEIVREDEWTHGHAGIDQPGHAIVVLARKPR